VSQIFCLGLGLASIFFMLTKKRNFKKELLYLSHKPFRSALPCTDYFISIYFYIQYLHSNDGVIGADPMYQFMLPDCAPTNPARPLLITPRHLQKILHSI